VTVASTSDPEPGDPADDDDPDRPDADEHHAAIRALLATFADWMRDRSRRIARRHDLDADDVFQLTWLRLLRSRMTADLTNDGIRTWLARRIHWAASELARQRRHDGGERIAADEVDALIAEADVQASRAASTAGSAVDAKLLDRIGLTRHQVHVVLSECSGLDLSLREYAHLVGRSYTAIRKDKERALDRIERWVGLNHEERRVFMAFRLAGSVEAGARRTGHSEAAFRGLLDGAHRKVDEALAGTRVQPDGPRAAGRGRAR
jgi:RNA polymerase sigma factor (sigma-70 family)